jgi:hypothetical protein
LVETTGQLIAEGVQIQHGGKPCKQKMGQLMTVSGLHSKTQATN